jgi:hypothetical protein
MGEGGTREEWYQYKYDCDQAGWKFTFKELGKELVTIQV